MHDSIENQANVCTTVIAPRAAFARGARRIWDAGSGSAPIAVHGGIHRAASPKPIGPVDVDLAFLIRGLRLPSTYSFHSKHAPPGPPLDHLSGCRLSGGRLARGHVGR